MSIDFHEVDELCEASLASVHKLFLTLNDDIVNVFGTKKSQTYKRRSRDDTLRKCWHRLPLDMWKASNPIIGFEELSSSLTWTVQGKGKPSNCFGINRWQFVMDIGLPFW